MVKTKTEDGITTFTDESAALPVETLQAVQAALRAGFAEFTTPTPENDDGRIAWRARRWIAIRDGEPAAFWVAYQELNPHFEVLGPAIDLNDARKGKK